METKYLPEGQLLATPQNREYCASLPALECACAEGVILEGNALLCDSDLNLYIDFPALPDRKSVV